MNRLRRAAILTRLVDRLRERGSWCGETHVQKAVFFVQALTRVPLEFDFILYKHGPFAFDLRDELTSLRADELVVLEPQWRYGPRIAPTDRSKDIQRLFAKTVRKYDRKIAAVAQWFGAKDVVELERLATALYIMTVVGSEVSINERADLLTELKPHISIESAALAFQAVDRMIAEAEETL